MIRAIVALNADGYVIKKSLVGLPASVMDYEEMQCLVNNTLIMATMDVVRKYLPQHIAMVSRKSLLADNDKALSTMAANIENQGVGDICVLANEGVLDEMDNIGLGYELVVVYPTEVGVPENLIAGKKRVDVQYCDKYMIARYEQSVTEASDVQISNCIDGLESYFNMVDNMDKRDKEAVDKIVHGVKMLNRALQRESSDNNFMGDSEDSYSGVGEIDSAEEIDRIWDTLQMVGDQMSDTTDLVLETQDTIAEVLSYMKNNLPIPQLMNRMAMVNGEIDGLRKQLGSHIEESLTAPKQKRDPLIWVIFGISILALIGTVINLCW